jgi:predicted metal-binding protein
MAKEAYHYGQRGLCVYMHAKAKETYHYGKIKRDLLLWQKRPIIMAKETYYYGKRDLLLWQKRPIVMAKEAYEHTNIPEPDKSSSASRRMEDDVTYEVDDVTYEVDDVTYVDIPEPDKSSSASRRMAIIMAKETYHYGKRGLSLWQKRPMCVYARKGKRDLSLWPKRPMCVYARKSKRDLSLWQKQKRPIIMAKETYYYGKRDLL